MALIVRTCSRCGRTFLLQENDWKTKINNVEQEINVDLNCFHLAGYGVPADVSMNSNRISFWDTDLGRKVSLDYLTVTSV